MPKQDDDKLRKKRLFIALSVAFGFIFLLSIAVVLMKPKPKHRATVIKTVTPSTTLSQQSWIAKSQAQLEQQAEEIARLKKAQRQAQQKEALLLKKLKESKVNNGKHSFNPMPLKKSEGYNRPNPYATKVKYPPPPKFHPTSFKHRQGRTTNKQQTQQVMERQENNLIAVALPVHYYTPKKQQKTKTQNQQTTYISKTNNKQQTNNKPSCIIPPGSFVSAFLLTGADVPTSGHGSVGPIPVVFRVMKNAQLPNLWKADIKSCFLLGQATGSLASERAYIRVDTLSCINNKGKTIVRHIQGYVTGADGKVGLAGRVVSKQGAMLARSLMAGFLQGIGEAFKQTQTNISVSPLGSTSSVAPNSNTLLKYGIGNGVGSATQSLAKFYMKMANQMFPVIEINAGRRVDVVFLKEVKMP